MAHLRLISNRGKMNRVKLMKTKENGHSVSLLGINLLQLNQNPRRPALSNISIAPYFPFCRIRIIDQFVCPDAHESWITIVPDKRFQPICHRC